jgi:hypothetical protein
MGRDNKDLLGMDPYHTGISYCWLIDVSPS